jgi:hypothetical protein
MSEITIFAERWRVVPLKLLQKRLSLDQGIACQLKFRLSKWPA